MVVIALTSVGAILRFWSPAHLGMVHFDEGIYALAGLWSLSPKGLADFDPSAIAYAPPGMPVLIGLSYLLFGVHDVSAILVSVCSGTLVIPLAAWLARRNFGAGAGGAAAAFAALSGPHIAFSRMALTDASFLLFWVLALILGQRFLDRPTAIRAALMGCGIGLVQLFKYNGWISGAVVVFSAFAWLLVPPRQWRSRRTAATWGWGFVAAIVAAAIYWPWFAFVESHGGYGRLLAHQQSYLGGFRSFAGHWSQQIAQSNFLSGGPIWRGIAGMSAGLAIAISRGDFVRGVRALPRIAAEVMGVASLALIPEFLALAPVAIVCMMMYQRYRSETRGEHFLPVAWAFTSVLTPFYHPYARLWLPIEGFSWIFLAGAFVAIRSRFSVPIGEEAPTTHRKVIGKIPWFFVGCFVIGLLSLALRPSRSTPRLLEPTDSLRQASLALSKKLPGDLKELRVYVRPPVLFYLALGGCNVARRQPDLERLLAEGDRRSWALLDMALVRQEQVQRPQLDQMLKKWTIVNTFPTSLNAPALLDADPAAARADLIDWSAPLLLVRPIPTEDLR